MTVDLIIAAVIILSVLVSLMRGFMREAISLGVWVLAIMLPVFYTAQFATLLPAQTFESPTGRAAISAAVLFFGTLIIGSLVSYLLQKILSAGGLGPTDRIIGILFGAARGGLIVVAVVLLAHLVPTIQQETFWNDSQLIPWFDQLARIMHGFLPPMIGQHFNFG